MEALDIRLNGGLTVVTGASGAGKSILLNALGLVLGERASTDLIRPGTERAEVNAEFDLTANDAAIHWLSEQELGDIDQPERCLLRRVINQDGRSRAFINDTPVTLQVMRQLAEGLVDIHGQDENQRLARKDVQLSLLDAYGVDAQAIESMAAAFRDWKATHGKAVELETKLTNIEDRAALLRYQLDELADLNLADGEFETLDAEFKRASQAHAIQEAVTMAIGALAELDVVRQHQRDLAAIDDDHAKLNAARDALTAASELNDDAVHELRGYLETLELDQTRLAELEERLNLVHELARKHRVPSEGLSAHHRALDNELGTLNADQGELEALQLAAANHRQTFEQIAESIGRQRRHAADGFASEVSACIGSLGITGGSLSVDFLPADSERGLEAVEFQIAANPKYPAAALSKVASGGERARISLAIQVVAAEKTRLPCLVLDEADIGIGGTTADVVGRLLRSLGTHTQVICVTHAPQVAALGDSHFRVEKDSEQDTQIHFLDTPERIEELARMLAGADVTDKTRSYAQTLLDEASSRTLH